MSFAIGKCVFECVIHSTLVLLLLLLLLPDVLQTLTPYWPHATTPVTANIQQDTNYIHYFGAYVFNFENFFLFPGRRGTETL